MEKHLVLGIDFGTDSVRAVVIDALDGKELGTGVTFFPRWKEGKYCIPEKSQFRQHPLDYLESLEISIKEALKHAPSGSGQKISGISIDTTGSTPVAVNKEGTPLALLPGMEENPNGMFILWKDHTANQEADEINKLSKSWGKEDFTKFSGGTYSSEWFWAKILHILRQDSLVRDNAFSWVEHCDWISAVLTGNTDPLALKRSRCAAGHKAMWHKEFDGLPSEEFLEKLDPLLKGIRKKLYTDTYTSDISIGKISREWAQRLNISEDTEIGVGAFDAHMGAVGAQIQPYYLCKVIGTSTCDMLIAPGSEVNDKLISGICGQVDGSITPGMEGMEAGQSAYGDYYAWFRELLLWPLKQIKTGFSEREILESYQKEILPALSKEAEAFKPGETDIIALDWINGRRTPFANHHLKAAITGISLGTSAPKLFRALIEATAFGSKNIVDCFISQGVPIKGIIALGGVAKKSPLAMQVLADVLDTKIYVAKAEQACALGAGMFASVCSGIHPDINSAQKAMSHGFEREYLPIEKNVEIYKQLYKKYLELGVFVEKSIK